MEPRLVALSANGEIAKFASSLFASFVAKCRGWGKPLRRKCLTSQINEK